jgi:hypothetical protein
MVFFVDGSVTLHEPWFRYVIVYNPSTRTHATVVPNTTAWWRAVQVSSQYSDKYDIWNYNGVLSASERKPPSYDELTMQRTRRGRDSAV